MYAKKKKMEMKETLPTYPNLMADVKIAYYCVDM